MKRRAGAFLVSRICHLIDDKLMEIRPFSERIIPIPPAANCHLIDDNDGRGKRRQGGWRWGRWENTGLGVMTLRPATVWSGSPTPATGVAPVTGRESRAASVAQYLMPFRCDFDLTPARACRGLAASCLHRGLIMRRLRLVGQYPQGKPRAFDQPISMPILLQPLHLPRSRERERVEALPLAHARGYTPTKPFSGHQTHRE